MITAPAGKVATWHLLATASKGVSIVLRKDRIVRQNQGDFLDRDRPDRCTRIRRLLVFHACSPLRLAAQSNLGALAAECKAWRRAGPGIGTFAIMPLNSA
jgi:hypothetical protein